MKTIELDLEDDLVGLLHQSNQPLKTTILEMIVLELYCQGKISSGKAGQLLNMPRFAFVNYASRLGIPFFSITEDEWESEKEILNQI